MLGRVVALESGFFTLAEMGASLCLAAGFDLLGLTWRQVVVALAVFSAALTALWVWVAVAAGRKAVPEKTGLTHTGGLSISVG
jgi:hypothetical protein